MLEAKKSVFFEKAFSVYNRNLLKRRFNSLRVSGLDFLVDRNKDFPLLIYANHSSWWDGLVAFQISRAARLDSFLMMEEKQLRNLRIFRRLGAFSVVREKPRQALKSIDYAASILREKSNRVVWIFPQGEILPNDFRPLVFFKGLAKIIQKVENCAVVPVAMRFEFSGEFKPDIFVKIKAPEFFDAEKFLLTRNATGDFERRLARTLDELKAQIHTQNYKQFENLI